AERMMDLLIDQGVEVPRGANEFSVSGKSYSKGSFVILMSQPYRANVKCLFEAQKYPDRRLYPGGPAEPPYDVAGWTLPMQMGVDYVAADRQFEAQLEKTGEAAQAIVVYQFSRSGAVPGAYYFSDNTDNSF